MPRESRRALASVWATFALLLCASSCNPTQPVKVVPGPGPATWPFPAGSYVVDEAPTWAPAGDSLYFRRIVPSSWGPPGLYVTGAAGGTARLLAPLQCAFALGLHLSPDGRMLAAGFEYRMLLVDAVTGSIRFPIFTPDGIGSADWLDANRLVVTRPLLAPGEPHDSSGLAIFDLQRGELRAIRTPSDVVFGADARCSPDKSWIAFTYARAIYLVRPDGSELRAIAVPPSGLYLDAPQWIDASHVLFTEGGSGPSHNQVVGVDGTGRRDWPWWIGRGEGVTPDHRRIVAWGQDRIGPDSLALVLYLRDLDDATGATAVPLTSYRPSADSLPVR